MTLFCAGWSQTGRIGQIRLDWADSTDVPEKIQTVYHVPNISRHIWSMGIKNSFLKTSSNSHIPGQQHYSSTHIIFIALMQGFLLPASQQNTSGAFLSNWWSSDKYKRVQWFLCYTMHTNVYLLYSDGLKMKKLCNKKYAWLEWLHDYLKG